MIERVFALSHDATAAVQSLLADEESRSGRRPLDEVNRLALTGLTTDAHRSEHWLAGDGALTGYAIVAAGGVAELSATDLPHALELLDALRDAYPHGSLWTHGDRCAGHLAAAVRDLPIERELVLMARQLPLGRPNRPLPDSVTVRPFDSDLDADDWLTVNRVAFADLPDQASWTRADLDLRLAAPWFDPADFLVARASDGSLAGFHWTKVDDSAAAGDDVSGEVFVIAVAPSWLGKGLAGALLDRGLSHLAAPGMRQAHLFVDADNTRAIGLYERAGFHRVDGDRLYRL